MWRSGPFDRFKRRLLLLIAVIILLLATTSAALAQVTGKVMGTVVDMETRQPLVGGQVTVAGTNLGNVSNEDGYYFINNVPVGVQRVTAQYLGYQAITLEQRILAGHTATLNFSLAGEVIQAEGILAVLELNPLVARDNTISKWRFTGETARALPTDNLTEMVKLGAGRIFEVTPEGEIVWEYWNPTVHSTDSDRIASIQWGERFTADEIDFPFNHGVTAPGKERGEEGNGEGGPGSKQ